MGAPRQKRPLYPIGPDQLLPVVHGMIAMGIDSPPDAFEYPNTIITEFVYNSNLL